MSSNSITLIESLYNSKKIKIYTHRDYKFTKKFAYMLKKPLFSIKTVKTVIPDLTYRKMNDWEDKKIIKSSRNKKEGWRKFSRLDIITLHIISDLKEFGFSSEKIRRIIGKIAKSSFLIYDINTKKFKKRSFLELEYFTFDCIFGTKNLLFICKNEKIYFLPEQDLFVFYIIDEGYLPLLTLPFYNYVAKIFSHLRTGKEFQENTKLINFINTRFTEKEKMILDIIRNGKYQEILIKKIDNKQLLINAKSRISGNFTKEDIIKLVKSRDYQNITVINDKGKTVSLIQEQRFKI